jgi:hypothetical protein
MNELDARALLCQLLPDLRTGAAAGRWTTRLESILTAVRDGGSAEQAMTDLGYDPSLSHEPATERGGPGPHVLWGGIKAEISGQYVCPEKPPCPRRSGRDADGRPPMCGLHNALMNFRQSS